MERFLSTHLQMIFIFISIIGVNAGAQSNPPGHDPSMGISKPVEVPDNTLVKGNSGREFKGVTMPEVELVQGKKLVLNGMGLREVDILSIYIKVYIAGLYLEKKTASGDEIVNSTSLKRMKLHFLRHVSSEDQFKSWKKGISENCAQACAEAKAQLPKLKELLPKVNEGDIMNYTLDEKSVNLEHQGKVIGTLSSPALVKAMLSTWVGAKPVSTDLRSGLLGK